MDLWGGKELERRPFFSPRVGRGGVEGLDGGPAPGFDEPGFDVTDGLRVFFVEGGVPGPLLPFGALLPFTEGSVVGGPFTGGRGLDCHYETQKG